jgi:hypothetical protein
LLRWKRELKFVLSFLTDLTLLPVFGGGPENQSEP